MILETHKFWEPDLRLEIVNGDDIRDTYANKKYVTSCQSLYQRWRATKMFSFIPGARLIRVMNEEDHCMLRCFQWIADDKQKYLGNIYTEKNYNGIQSRAGIKEAFNYIQDKFGISLAQCYRTTVTVTADLSNYDGKWPTVDYLPYLNAGKTAISNKPSPQCFRLTDYEEGTLYRAYY